MAFRRVLQEDQQRVSSPDVGHVEGVILPADVEQVRCDRRTQDMGDFFGGAENGHQGRDQDFFFHSLGKIPCLNHGLSPIIQQDNRNRFQLLTER